VPSFSNEFKPTTNLQLSVAPQEAQNIEVYTREEAKSPKQRAGRITASKICATDLSHPSHSLVSQLDLLST